MTILDELLIHIESLEAVTKEDTKLFAPVVQYIRRLREKLSASRSELTREEIGLICRKLDEFWAKYRPSPRSSGFPYIPPYQMSNSDGTVREVVALAQKIEQLPSDQFSALQTTNYGSPLAGKQTSQGSQDPCVFIGHGQSKLWARVQVFLKDDHNLKIVSYESESRASNSITSILEDMLNQATFAVLILTAEDETSQGAIRARQNVVHEVGLFQGCLGFRNVVLLMQDGIEQFSNIAGLQYIPFSNDRIEQTFYELTRTLKREGQIT